MPLEITRHNAPQALLALIEQCNQRNAIWGALQFRFSGSPFKPQENKILEAVKPLLGDRQSRLYFCEDSDVFVAWRGVDKNLPEKIASHVYERLYVTAENHLHHYYDLLANRKALVLLCQQKIAALPERPPAPSAPVTPVAMPRLSPEQIALFRKEAATRKRRRQPEILIVEDQPFSSRLLRSVLEQRYKTYVAENAAQAWELYAAHAPDICLLDIELPDMNGHRLARLIGDMDKDAYIIMVTANNYLEDVTSAKENGAKGFIVKPYSQQKILDAVQKFSRNHEP